MSRIRLVNQASTPSTPGTGQSTVFVGPDKRPRVVNDAGVVTYMNGGVLRTSTLGSGSGTRTLDMNVAHAYTATSGGTSTWVFSNPPTAPDMGFFVLELTNGGAHTQQWPGSVIWDGGTAPSLQTSGVDILTFITDDGGTTWRGLRTWRQA